MPQSEIDDISRRASGMEEAEGFVSVCKRFAGEKRLTRDMVEAFVDRIVVFQDERVEIRWKFGEI